jgi:hypothetical protein
MIRIQCSKVFHSIVLSACVFGLGSMAQASESEVEISFEAAPVAVQQAIRKTLGPSAPKKLDKETENGADVYEAEFKAEGVKQSLSVAASGDILELEKAVDVAKLPAAVVAALKQAKPGCSLKNAESVQLKAVPEISFFEVKILSGGKKEEIKVKPNGQIVD